MLFFGDVTLRFPDRQLHACVRQPPSNSHAPTSAPGTSRAPPRPAAAPAPASRSSPAATRRSAGGRQQSGDAAAVGQVGESHTPRRRSGCYLCHSTTPTRPAPNRQRATASPAHHPAPSRVCNACVPVGSPLPATTGIPTRLSAHLRPRHTVPGRDP